MAAKRESGDDDYWGASQAQKIGKNLNLFSDEVSVDDAKSLLRKIDFGDDDDNCDTIAWDGTPVGNPAKSHIEMSATSARYRPTVTTTVPHVPTKPQGRATFTPNLSGAGNYSEPSLSDVVARESPPLSKSKPTHTEVAKLEAQINFLNKELHGSRKERYSVIPAKDMVLRMIAGESFTLEFYKSKEDKLKLLDEAIKVHDGNTIIAAALFLKKTIKPATFKQELLARPIAVEHYLCYLRERYEIENLVDMLSYLGRSDEAAMIKYKQAISTSNPETKIRNLQTVQRAHFCMNSQLSRESLLVNEYVSLLERQLPVEKADSSDAQRGLPKFREHPRKASIVDEPVITTLYYSCFYHYDLAENSLASPIGIKKQHKLSDRQFTWVALAARARLKQWTNVEELFQTKKIKGWLGGTKMKAIIPFDRVIGLLHKLNAPKEILEKYCNLITDTQQRLDVAQKYGAHSTIIETYVQMKDRRALVTYQNQLTPHSQEWYYAGDRLKISSVKWKN